MTLLKMQYTYVYLYVYVTAYGVTFVCFLMLFSGNKDAMFEASN